MVASSLPHSLFFFLVKTGYRSVHRRSGIPFISIILLFLFTAARRAAVEGAVIAESGTAQAAYDVHKVCHVIVHKDDIVHLLAEVQRRYQQHGDRDTAGKARQRGQHDEHEHDAGCTQQPRVGKQNALQHTGDQRSEQNAFEQRDAAVFFLHGRAHYQQQQHIIEKMLPVGMTQHMAKQPDVAQRVPPRGAVHAEQIHGAPAVRPAVCQQHQDGQQKNGKDDRRVILELQLQLALFRKQSFPSQYCWRYPLVCAQYAPMLWPGWFVTSSLRYAARPQAAGCQLSAASTVGYSTSAYQNAVGRPSSTWFTSSTAPSGKR